MPEAIAIYSRKSRFSTKGESIENQVELCRHYIESHYNQEAPSQILVYEDEGFSGKNTQRPQFKRLLQDAKKKRFSVLVCYRLDRISRNVGDFAGIMDELNSLGISFVSIRETFDTSTPMGRAMLYIASVFAQLERETIAERIRDNLYELSKTGRWLGGTTPTGYESRLTERISADGKLRKACRLNIIPEEARLVKTIFSKFLETGSLTRTDAYLVQNGYRTKKGNNFSRYSIRSILTNPVYMIADEAAYHYITDNGMELFSDRSKFDAVHGILAYNRTVQLDGKAHRDRAMQDWIVSVAEHEGLIPGRTWIKVRELIHQNSSKSYKKPRSNEALLSGILICGGCGSRMRPKLTRRVNPEGKRVYDYICIMKEKSNSQLCNMKNVNGILLDRGICDELAKLSGDTSLLAQEIGNLKPSYMEGSYDYKQELNMVKKKIADNEKEIAALVAALAKSSKSSAQQYLIEQIETCHGNMKNLKRQKEELAVIMSGRELTGIDLQEVKSLCFSFGDMLEQATIHEKRQAVKEVVRQIIWDGEKAHLYLGNYIEKDMVFSESRELLSNAPQCEDSK